MMITTQPHPFRTLSAPEKIYFRDRFRAGREAALAQAEAFLQICFALEEFGQRLLGSVADMGHYERALKDYVLQHGRCCANEASLSALSTMIRWARNDAMHTGAYARQVTSKAVEYCLLLEDALMNEVGSMDTVAAHMIKEPVCVEPWHLVSKARQLMLTHSFSNLPVKLDDGWFLVTEHGLAGYLSNGERRELLARQIHDAAQGLGLVRAPCVPETMPMSQLLSASDWSRPGAPLWLILDANNQLSGVISLSELL